MMRPLAARLRALPLLTAVVLAAPAWLSACTGLSSSRRDDRAVAFTTEWPSKPTSLARATEDWTRTARIIDDYDTLLDVSATFLSPSWRAAYVAHRVGAEKMSAEAASEIRREQVDAHDRHYEVELLVATYHYEENDLQKNAKSTWRLVLVDDQGNEIAPVEIARDRRRRGVIGAYFPALGEHHTPYVARFPRTTEFLAPGSRKLSLRMSSARGKVELIWSAK